MRFPSATNIAGPHSNVVAIGLCAVIALGAFRAEAVVTQYKIDDLLEQPIKAYVNGGQGDVEIGGGCNALVEQCFITIPLLGASPATATDVVYFTDVLRKNVIEASWLD